MSLEVLWTPYGRPAAAALHARVADAKRADPLCPVAVVVPTNSVGVALRRMLGSGELGPVTGAGAGVAGLTLLTVFRLAELLGASALAGSGRRPVSTPVLAAVVRRALREAPGRFAPVAAHPATEAALIRAHQELSEVSEEALDALAGPDPQSRAAEVVRLHRVVRASLAQDWYVEADLMAAAAQAVTSAPLIADLGTVLVHLPQDLPRSAARLLRALAERVPMTVIAGRTGSGDADADVLRSIDRLGGPPPAALAPEPDPPVATEVISASDADEEVRAAVRRVVRALRDRVPLERMALLYPLAEPYARLTHEHLVAASIPYNGAAARPLGDRLLGRWLLDALDLAGGDAAPGSVGARELRRPDVFNLLTAAPVVDPAGGDPASGDLAGHARGARRVRAARWERVSRVAGVVQGADWHERLGQFAAARRAEADHEDASDEGRDWLVRRSRRDAGDAEGLARFVAGLRAALAESDGAGTWRELVAWLRSLAERYLGGERLRDRWPAVERRAADKVEAALDRLAALDAVDDAPTLAALRRALALELEADLGREGRLGHGLLVGPLTGALGVELDVVVVLGCAEGVLPSRIREDSLLPDAERARARGELRQRARRVGVEHRHLLAALASARVARVLCYPRGDLRRSHERPPSRWLADSLAALQPQAEVSQRRRLPGAAPWLAHHASFAEGVTSNPLPATRQEYALRALGDHVRGGGQLESHPLLTDAVLRRGLGLVRARRSAAFTRFDGDLSDPALQGLVPLPTDEEVTSPTRLESWAACPHDYFLTHVLGVGVLEDPEEIVSISALDRGHLVHRALEQWLVGEIGRGLPPPDLPWPADAGQRLMRLAEQQCVAMERAGVTGHPRLWARDRARLLLDFARLVDHDDGRRRSLAATPVAAELAFGTQRSPVTVPLPDGRCVRFRGVVDRLEEQADEGLVVTDYKTGGSSAYSKLKDDPVLAGRKLQLPVYALAARALTGRPDAPVRADYWFVSTKGEFTRIGYQVDDAVLDHFTRVLTEIVEGIAAGVFPARPPVPNGRPGFIECTSCDPDGLGTAARRRDWERKRHDPALAGYVRLAEPDTET